jgi:shikimate kinase
MQEDLPKVIFLVGFMGAGKSTVGRLLAERLGYDFFDLDEIIEKQAGRGIREIFRDSGEPEFRRLEGEAIGSLAKLNSAVVALGGGAYVPKENREIVGRIGKTVWLDCPLEICLSRVGGDRARPMLDVTQDVNTLYLGRLPSYQAADLVLQCGAAEPDEIVRMIMQLLEADL